MPSFQTIREHRLHLRLGVALFVSIIVIVNAGCSKLKNDNSATNTGGGGHTETATPNSSPAAAPASADGSAKPAAWETTATSLNEAVGQTMRLDCSTNGTLHSVWGSDIYTSDSSICSAAVHSGLIT